MFFFNSLIRANKNIQHIPDVNTLVRCIYKMYEIVWSMTPMYVILLHTLLNLLGYQDWKMARFIDVSAVFGTATTPKWRKTTWTALQTSQAQHRFTMSQLNMQSHHNYNKQRHIALRGPRDRILIDISALMIIMGILGSTQDLPLCDNW